MTRPQARILRPIRDPKIEGLYKEWKRSADEQERVQSLYGRERATAEEVSRARDAAEAAWQPYREARARAHALRLQSSLGTKRARAANEEA